MARSVGKSSKAKSVAAVETTDSTPAARTGAARIARLEQQLAEARLQEEERAKGKLQDLYDARDRAQNQIERWTRILSEAHDKVREAEELAGIEPTPATETADRDVLFQVGEEL